VRYAQGYYLGHPAPLEELGERSALSSGLLGA
jgi:EAL domain-containing protein (putative c-di-GMP-specific phosphodiesterase class I)